MEKLYPKSRLLIKDESNNVYRLCSFFHEPQKGGKYSGKFYVKFMFPELKNKKLKRTMWTQGIASNGTHDRMSEVSFHYDEGKITAKHDSEKSLEIDAESLQEKGFLYLITFRWKNLSWMKEFAMKKIRHEHDIFLKVWDKKPRGIQFILSKEPVPGIKSLGGQTIYDSFGFRHEKTELYLTIVDYFPLPEETPHIASILVHAGGSITKLFSLVEI